jgi:hypothetical protein
MDRDDVPVNSEGAPAPPPVNPRPYGRQRRDHDDAWSCSSGEAVSDGLEMQSYSGKRPDVANLE